MCLAGNLYQVGSLICVEFDELLCIYMCREVSHTHIWLSDGSHKTEEIVRPNLSEKLVSVFKYVVQCSSGLPTWSFSARSSFNTLEEKVAQALFRSCMDPKLWIYKRSCCFLSRLSMFCKREHVNHVIPGSHRKEARGH